MATLGTSDGAIKAQNSYNAIGERRLGVENGIVSQRVAVLILFNSPSSPPTTPRRTVRSAQAGAPDGW